MNYIWSAMIVVSLAAGAAQGRIESVVAAGLGGAGEAFYIVLGFAGIMCFWSGILRLLEKGGISAFISKALSPVLARVFGKNSAAAEYIAMNVTANLLGMGNAATPSGVRAMQELDRENDSEYPSRRMCIFAVMNTASLQIIPATVAAMRAGAGAKHPFDIILPVWITSLLSLGAAVVTVCIIYRRKGERVKG